jgi:preprotein translocase subunit SecF
MFKPLCCEKSVNQVLPFKLMSLSGFAISLFTGILIGTFSSITISATVPQLIGLSADYYNKKDEEICALP